MEATAAAATAPAPAPVAAVHEPKQAQEPTKPAVAAREAAPAPSLDAAVGASTLAVAGKPVVLWWDQSAWGSALMDLAGKWTDFPPVTKAVLDAMQVRGASHAQRPAS